MDIDEETGIQLTDKYDLYGESCDYFNSRTLFENGFCEIQTKNKMIQEAQWKFKKRNKTELVWCACFEQERGIRIGLCLCIIFTFIMATLIIIASQKAANIFGSILFYLITICLFICFIIRTNDYIKEYGLNCCKKKERTETMLNIDDFKIDFVKSKGLYFDDKRKSVYDMEIMVNYSENTKEEVIYIQNKKKLFDFEDIIEIGFNEMSNEPDFSEYGVYDSLPSYSYNKIDDDYCRLIIKYKKEIQSLSKSKYENELKPNDVFQVKQDKDNNDNTNIGKWKDIKMSKREFDIKLLQLKNILDLVGLTDKVNIKEEPYERVHRNPVMKL